MQTRPGFVLFAAIVAAAAGCGGGGGTSNGNAPGSLHVAMAGLPSGASALVHVTGPDGFAQDTTGGDLAGLAPGAYLVLAPDVVIGGTHVPTVYVGTAAPAAIDLAAGQQGTTTVTYAPRAGSGALWIAPPTADVSGYGNAVLAGAGAVASPAAVASVPGTSDARGLAVDTGGAMWTADSSGVVLKFSPSQLGPSSTGLEDAWLTDATLSGGGPMAFDADGNLWVSGTNAKALARYTPAQLAQGGSLPPSVVITLSGNDPADGLAFDAAGNLWLTRSSAGQVARILAADLGASATRAPAPLQASALSMPFGLAFDAAGDLWVACAGSSSVVRFSASALSSPGTVTPSVVLSSASGSLESARGVVVDALGDLWVLGPAQLVRLGADQLGTSGTPTPALTLGVGGWALAADPTTAR